MLILKSNEKLMLWRYQAFQNLFASNLFDTLSDIDILKYHLLIMFKKEDSTDNYNNKILLRHNNLKKLI